MSKALRQVTFADDLVSEFRVKTQLDHHLLCPVCKKRYVSPLLLPCLHSICKSCLDDNRVAPKNGKIPRCPSCPQPLDLTREYPVNFVLNNLVNTAALGDNSHHLISCDSCDANGEIVSMRCDDCFQFLCNFCATAHRRMSATRTHNLTSVHKLRNQTFTSISRPCFCALHAGNQIMYLCVTCTEPVCRECVVSKHQEHKLEKPEKISKDLRFHLGNMSDKLKRKRKDVNDSVNVIYEAITKLEKHYQTVRSSIEDYFETLVLAVKRRMKSLLAELDSRSESKLDKLRTEKVRLEACLRGAQGSCEFAETVLSEGNDLEVVSVTHMLNERIAGLYQDLKDSPTEFDDKDDIMFTANDDGILERLDKSGDLVDNRIPTDPSLSKISPNALHVTSGQVSQFELTAVNQKGLNQSKGGDELRVVLTYSSGRGSIDNSGFRYNVTDHNNGSYTVNFVVTKPDSYKMHVLLDGGAVESSPLVLTVTPKDWIGSGCIIRGEDWGGFANPHSVVIGPRENMIVADSNNHKVKVIGANGQLMGTIGTQGGGEGEFNFPYCLCTDQQKNFLIVSDGHNNRVQILTSAGRFVKSFGIAGGGDGCFNLPHGVATDPSDNIYVADSGNSRLQIFTPEGYYMRKVVSDQLNRPWGVAITPRGQIVTTDYNNHKVFVFHRNGKLDFCFGSRGDGDGEFNNPAGITIDSDGQFVVADRSNHRVQIFQPDGTFVTKFGGKGTGDGLMRFPTGVAVDKAGHLYVADTFNNRIQVFSLAAV
ncbi:E3 ubiquitin-protein ligase TRIM71 [Nematostella vectensis]|uniref:E3 ubiquitin-protein ligase TRIM71 n=1 Tax=Nematostella vectensis TaxID=45351 RepID=UPI002076D84D|nr:E3 ubiquitin-protein ligase TRIM71 [Nematostella vectensis]